MSDKDNENESWLDEATEAVNAELNDEGLSEGEISKKIQQVGKRREVTNEDLMDTLEHKIDEMDCKVDEQGKDIAYIKGVLAELQRNDTRTIKILEGIVTALLAIVTTLVAYLIYSGAI